MIAAGLAIGGVLYLLDSAWGYGGAEVPAPQATLMKMIVEGIMGGNLPWNLVFTGVFLAIALEVLRIPVMPFAIGLYLPIYLNTSIMIGGVVGVGFPGFLADKIGRRKVRCAGSWTAARMLTRSSRKSRPPAAPCSVPV